MINVWLAIGGLLNIIWRNVVCISLTVITVIYTMIYDVEMALLAIFFAAFCGYLFDGLLKEKS